MIRNALILFACLLLLACASKPKDALKDALTPAPTAASASVPTDGVVVVSLWYRAARLGDVETLKRLSADREKQPIDHIDGNGVTALMVAARSGQVEAVRFLLANGADVKRSDREWATALGYCVLGAADDDKRMAVAKLLIENGADPFLPDGFGAVPVRELVSLGYLEIVKTLNFKESFACDRAKAPRGDESIVELARKSEQPKLVQYLQSIGCQ